MVASMMGAANAHADIKIDTLTSLSLSDAQTGWDFRRDGQGQIWLAYYDKRGNLQLRKPTGNFELMAQEEGSNKQTGLALVAEEAGVSVLWREKLPSKGLYLYRITESGKSNIELAEDSEVLTRFEALRYGNKIAALWYGEKQQPDSESLYHLYFRSIDTSTNALSPIERLMPGFYPMMAMDQQGNILVASWDHSSKPGKMMASFRASDSNNFGPVVTIAPVPNMAPLYQIFENKGRWFVVWLGMYGENSMDFLLEGAYSDDSGSSWKQFAFEDLRGIDVSSLDLVTDEQGHILLALSGRYRVEPDNDKHKLFLVRSEDNGSNWSVSSSVQNPSLRSKFNAKKPKVVWGHEKGEVILVWEDWREIRSRLYASYSNDFGKSWSIKNLALPHHPNLNQGLRSVGHDIWTDSKDQIHVISPQANSDRLDEYDLTKISFSVDDLKGLERAALPGAKVESDSAPDQEQQAKAREEALRARSSAFWAAMIEGDHQKTYEFYDPFYKASTNSLLYQVRMGRIKYSQFDIGEIKIEGNVGTTEAEVMASVPPFKAPKTGEIIEKPEKAVPVKDRWLWIDGEWYREFYSQVDERRYTQY